MYYDHGCHGEVVVGRLPEDVVRRLASQKGEWLEYEVATGKIVVRHVQPTSGPDLPLVVGELVQMLAVIPTELHGDIPGGDFYVHSLDTGQFVRLHVARGGAVNIRWAHPDFAQAEKGPYRGRDEIGIDPHVHRLNGEVSLRVEDARATATALQTLADSFEGLYPQGTCRVRVEGDDRVQLEMRDLNLDAHLLVEALLHHAIGDSVEGGFEVRSFGEAQPEDRARVVFEEGRVLALHPRLWPEESA